MNKVQIRKMILQILETVDYDLYKSFLKDSSEDWESSQEEMDQLILIVEKHLKKHYK
jgi:hypothetical protein